MQSRWGKERVGYETSDQSGVTTSVSSKDDHDSAIPVVYGLEDVVGAFIFDSTLTADLIVQEVVDWQPLFQVSTL